MGGTSYDAEMPTDIPDGFIVIRDRTHPGGYRAVDPATITGGGGGGSSRPLGMNSVPTGGVNVVNVNFTLAPGDTDKVIYTCPVDKVAFLYEPNTPGADFLVNLGTQIFAWTGSGANGLVTVKAGGVDYGDLNVNVALTTAGYSVGLGPLGLNAGEELTLTSPGGGPGLVGRVQLVEVDAIPSGLKVIHGILPVVANSVIYAPTSFAQLIGGSVEVAARTVAASPTTLAHGDYIPDNGPPLNLDPGSLFEGSLAGGSDGYNAGNLNPIWNMTLGPGDELQAWADNTGLPLVYSLIAQELV